MSEEEIIRNIEHICRWKVFGDKYTITDIESIEGLLDLYSKEKKTSHFLQGQLDIENAKLIEYETTLDIFNNREYRKKYLEERRSEEENLLYPDADEIYKRYYEQQEKNKKLEKENTDMKEVYLKTAKPTNLFTYKDVFEFGVAVLQEILKEGES